MGNNTISSDFKKAPKESRTEGLAAQSPTALDHEAQFMQEVVDKHLAE